MHSLIIIVSIIFCRVTRFISILCCKHFLQRPCINVWRVWQLHKTFSTNPKGSQSQGLLEGKSGLRPHDLLPLLLSSIFVLPSKLNPFPSIKPHRSVVLWRYSCSVLFHCGCGNSPTVTIKQTPEFYCSFSKILFQTFKVIDSHVHPGFSSEHISSPRTMALKAFISGF